MEKEKDVVNHPSHYKSKSGLEVIEVIRAFTEDVDGLEGYYTGNILKYICRWRKKNGEEDLKKAGKYLEWLIEYEEKKKTPPRNGRYSWDSDPETISSRCYIPPMPSYYKSCKTDNEHPFCRLFNVRSESGERDFQESLKIADLFWNDFCDTFIHALEETSKEKENKEDEE